MLKIFRYFFLTNNMCKINLYFTKLLSQNFHRSYNFFFLLTLHFQIPNTKNSFYRCTTWKKSEFMIYENLFIGWHFIYNDKGSLLRIFDKYVAFIFIIIWMNWKWWIIFTIGVILMEWLLTLINAKLFFFFC